MHLIPILLILLDFIVVVIFLTLLWRIAVALDSVGRILGDIVIELKKLADRSGPPK